MIPPEIQLAALRQYGLSLLARRDYSQSELTQKLAAKGATTEQISGLLQDYQARGWQSDQRFAESYTHYRRQKGVGPLKLAYALKQRGINAELIQETLTDDMGPWILKASQVREKRFGSSLPQDKPSQYKQIQFLRQRGFTMSIIQAVFAKATEIDDE